MKFTIYTANCCGRQNNAVYPNRCVIGNEDDFSAAVAYDHVCAEYKNSHRSIDDFLSADCSPFDNDNDHSDNSEDWIYPEDYEQMFPDVAYIVAPSRSSMKPKGGKSARPRHHVYFPHGAITDSDEYKALKEMVIEQYPFFDDNAADAARFVFGNPTDEIIWHEGNSSITDLMGSSFADWDAAQSGISEGSRNSTMSHYAGRIIKRLGNTAEARRQFLKEAEKCTPPLEDAELSAIWASAVKFGAKVSAQEGYIPPEQYNQDFQLIPEDFSDVGQAIVLSREYEDRLRYSPSTDYLVYNGSFWEESQPNAQGIAQELTARQLEEAETEIERCMQELSKNGAWAMLAAMGPKKAVAAFNEAQQRAFDKYERAETYRKYAIRRRDRRGGKAP